MNKSAKKMFEELGYVYEDYQDYFSYTKIRLTGSNAYRTEEIHFNKRFKDVIQFYSKNNNENQTHTTIELDVLKAIQQQLKELEWIE